MKITEVRAYTISSPLDKPWRIAGLVMSEMTATLVEVKDIARCGGFTEARKIDALDSSHGVTVAPHTGASGAVAAAVLWASSLSNLYLFEHMCTENPLRTEILKEAILECQNGLVKGPTGPGLGIEIDKNKMKKYLKG
jgi:L-alanine-DL-glutamate epimerase-like enolase superfamily enzyme